MLSIDKNVEDIIKKIVNYAKKIENPGIKSLIQVNGNSVSINWNKLVKFQHTSKDRLDTFTTAILFDLGIVTWDSKGNYRLIQDNRNMNPTLYPSIYFGSKEDALDYRKALISERKSAQEKMHLRINPINLVQYLD